MQDTTTIQTLSTLLRSKSYKLATAESCTGGMISAAMTDLSGSSDVFDRGFVTYSNQAKIDMLGVSPATLTHYGAVSAETAQEMCEGALKHSLADCAIAVTGIAGPSGGSADKPVGLVYIGLAAKGHPSKITRHIFSGDRAAVRQQTVDTALTSLIHFLSHS